MTRTCITWIAALLAGTAALAVAEPAADSPPAKALLRKSFLGEKPPEILSEPGHWFGLPPNPRLEQLTARWSGCSSTSERTARLFVTIWSDGKKNTARRGWWC